MIIVIVIVVFVNFSSHAYIFNFHVKTSAWRVDNFSTKFI